MTHAAAWTVALAGNPNSGKTTIYNNLTGSRQRVGNYSGVTVEKREGYCRLNDQDIKVVDLPGTYSLTAYAEDEVVARQFLVDERPDVIVDIIDASNLERNLYLAVQLMELELPVALALNMADVAEARGIQICDGALAEGFGVPIVRTVGTRKQGMGELLTAARQAMLTKQRTALVVDYGADLEQAIGRLTHFIKETGCDTALPARWLAIKLLENDQDIVERIGGMPGGKEILAMAAKEREHFTQQCDEDAELMIAAARYRFIGRILEKVLTATCEYGLNTSDKIDRILTNRVYGLPIFLALMWLLFNIIFTIGEYPQKLIEDGVALFGETLGELLPAGELKSLVVDGIIGGVGGVIVFLPNILLLFLGIAILEDTGYMARVAFIMDRVMRAVGLHGKSFIPLLLGFGCSVPAIMGTRTLENPRDRLVTILVAPLMSCSARLPVYTVLIAAFFSEELAGSVLFSVYLLGIGLAIVMARIFRSVLFPGAIEPFVMELPPYHIPTLRSVLMHMWERSLLYLKKAGTIILAVSILVWFLCNYPAAPEGTDAAQQLAQSYAGRIGHTIEPIIKPLGFDWKVGVGLFAAFTAKEVLVSTLGTIYSVEAADETSVALKAALAADPNLSPLIAYTLMVFVLIYAPCLATIAVIKRETNSWKWALFSLVYSTVLAWVVAWIVYRIGGMLL